MRKTAILLVGALVVGLLGACGHEVEPGHREPERPEISGVKVQEVETIEQDELYEVSGTVRSTTASTLSSKVMGVVMAVKAREGQRVEKGQLLIEIEGRDVEQKVRAAEQAHEAALKELAAARQQKELAEVTYGRIKKLYEERATNEQELDQARTKRNVAALGHEQARAGARRARAALEEARAYQSYTRIEAPFDAIVTAKMIEPGGMAAPGRPLMTIEDNRSYRIEVPVDESYAGRIEEGMEATVEFEALGRRLTGTVVEITPMIDVASRTFLVKVHLGEEKLKSGLYGRVSFRVGSEEVVLVPSGAVVERGQLTGVYRVTEDNKALFTLIRTGRRYGSGQVEVLSGIRPGDRVVADYPGRIPSGAVIKAEKAGPR